MRFLGVEVMSYADYGILIRCYVDQATTSQLANYKPALVIPLITSWIMPC
jgi:hypothetical protein